MGLARVVSARGEHAVEDRVGEQDDTLLSQVCDLSADAFPQA